MRAKLIYPVVAFIMMAMMGCGDLSEELVSSTTADGQFATSEGLDQALVGAYKPLRGFWGREPGLLMTMFGTDLFTIGQSYNPWWDTYGGGLNPSVLREPQGEELVWDRFYRGINNANTVISRAKEIDEIDQETKNRKVAEARFLRAHYYFILVQHFGPIHITTEETREVELQAERAPVEEVYSLIIDDLNFAREHLPIEQEQPGQPTHYAAINFLAKVHLTRKNWEKASNYAIEVINSGQYRLLDDYSDVFDPFKQEHDEVIWSVQWNSNSEVNQPDNQLQRYLSPRQWYIDGLVGDEMYGIGIARFRPTEYLIKEIYNNDYREGEKVNIQNDVRYKVTFKELWRYNDKGNIPDGSAVGDTAAWFTVDPIVQEMSDEEVKEKEYELRPMRMWNDSFFSVVVKHRYPNNRRHDRDYMWMRLGETYLIAAEALMRQGKNSEAVEYFNKVRKRAEAPGEEIPLMTASELDIDEILDERARELAGELHRWTDLKRTGKLLERAREGNPRAEPQEYHRLRPIPQRQIDRTENDYPQNPGY